ncbi:hypothetical protein ASG90_20560 [Nocardioides sp. Soil797]|nr:hypothetical protein ASG90_20560 [Nocardioides sp. Soil797]
MTAEIAAAKAAASAAAAALGEDADTNAHLNQLAVDHPAMQVAAEARAKRIALRQEVLTTLYERLFRWTGLASNYFEHDFAHDLAERTADIPEENMKAPSPSVAVPAMQGLAYSVDEPALKDMYLNLLSAATDDRRHNDAHPSFAEVIRQLSPEEAARLRVVLIREIWPIAIAKHAAPGGGHNVLARHLMGLNSPKAKTLHVQHRGLWLDNWVRLGLVSLDYAHHLTAADAYTWLDSHPEVVAMRTDPDGAPLDFDKGVCLRSKFGDRFAHTIGVLPFDVANFTGPGNSFWDPA